MGKTELYRDVEIGIISGIQPGNVVVGHREINVPGCDFFNEFFGVDISRYGYDFDVATDFVLQVFEPAEKGGWFIDVNFLSDQADGSGYDLFVEFVEIHRSMPFWISLHQHLSGEVVRVAESRKPQPVLCDSQIAGNDVSFSFVEQVKHGIHVGYNPNFQLNSQVVGKTFEQFVLITHGLTPIHEIRSGTV